MMAKTTELNYTSVKSIKKKSRNVSLTIQKINHSAKGLKWSWSCSSLKNDKAEYQIQDISDSNQDHTPQVGDVAIFRIKKIGKHRNLVSHDNKQMRLYENDLFIGVFGNRYASDAFEGRVKNLDKISILTAAGMVGTVRYRNKNVKRSTKISFEGYLCDDKDNRINLKKRMFKKNNSMKNNTLKNLILVVGSGMNSGKTTTACKLIHQLSKKNLKVSGCKLTGSVSHRDKYDMMSAGSSIGLDFSDYGFPSTYLCSEDELMDLFYTMISDIKEKTDPDVTVMEIADGILQRETAFLLKNKDIQNMTKGIVLASTDALSALYSVEQLQKINYNILAVSGAITSSPLSCKEFQKKEKQIPLASSAPDSGDELGEKISATLLN